MVLLAWIVHHGYRFDRGAYHIQPGANRPLFGRLRTFKGQRSFICIEDRRKPDSVRRHNLECRRRKIEDRLCGPPIDRQQARDSPGSKQHDLLEFPKTHKYRII